MSGTDYRNINQNNSVAVDKPADRTSPGSYVLD